MILASISGWVRDREARGTKVRCRWCPVRQGPPHHGAGRLHRAGHRGHHRGPDPEGWVVDQSSLNIELLSSIIDGGSCIFTENSGIVSTLWYTIVNALQHIYNMSLGVMSVEWGWVWAGWTCQGICRESRTVLLLWLNCYACSKTFNTDPFFCSLFSIWLYMFS